MNKAEAAVALSVKESEVADVGDSPAGTVVTTTDGASYVIVPEDSPDGEGKTGLMFLAAPTETYGGTFPVYAGPPAKEPATKEPSAPDVDPSGEEPPVEPETRRGRRS